MVSTTLAPGLLLAAPRLGDRNFERTVVLMGHHDHDGALGWVLNGQPLVPVRQLLQEAALVPPGVVLPATPSFDAPACVGGPVMSGSAWLLFEREPSLPDYESAHDLGCGFAVTGARAAIEAVASGQGPRVFRLLLGYAGWGPGQLEGEIGAGGWLPASIDRSLLSTLELDRLWDTAYSLSGTSPMAFSSPTRGSA
ncbi:MAG: YqgE/AlgH family protein [Myxococcales bacterium]|nr:MAG: YqgE/AlgH family protein [Myxococcales bacterium]